MKRRIPIAAFKIPVKDIFLSLGSLFGNARAETELKQYVAAALNKKHVFFVNSGLASFFVIIKSLKEIFGKKEVILPAYTAGSLIVAIKKAGLKPVLCDISMDDFNMDVNLLPDVISQDTLCILGVHMFGIVSKGLTGIKDKGSDVYLIEDCAQSLGSKINGQVVGNVGDVSFFSFNRGKNLPTYAGGAIATNDEQLAGKLTAEIEAMKGQSFTEKFSILFKILALSLVVRPWIYGLVCPLLSRFREVAPAEDIEVKKYTDFQVKIALALLKNIDKLSNTRYENGMKLISGLKDIDGVIVPKIAQDTQPAFNRLPIVFKDLGKKKRVELALRQAGIETSGLYFKPLHHMFDLGYKKESFPQAVYLAEHLLTLPVHPLLTDRDLENIIANIRE